MNVESITRIAILIGEEDTTSEFGCIGLTTPIIVKRYDPVEGKAVEIEIPAGDFAPVGPDKSWASQQPGYEGVACQGYLGAGPTTIGNFAAYSSPKYSSKV